MQWLVIIFNDRYYLPLALYAFGEWQLESQEQWNVWRFEIVQIWEIEVKTWVSS